MDLHTTLSHQVSDGMLRVHVSREERTGPLLVTSRNAQPLGQQYRFKSFVRLEMVQAVIRGWMAALPDDYCLRPECRDLLAKHWADLRDQLAAIPCVSSAEKAEEVEKERAEAPGLGL